MRAALLALLLATEVQAAVVGVVPLGDKQTLLLQDDKGVCVGQAHRAEVTDPGKPPIPGCWIISRGHVVVAFFDGDMGAIPLGAVQKPKDT